MVFVLNKCFGGWSLSDWAVEQLGVEDNYPLMSELDVDKLVQLIKDYGSEKVSGCCAKLRVVEVPDTCTDYEIDEYDGIERVIYVVDGKIYHA